MESILQLGIDLKPYIPDLVTRDDNGNINWQKFLSEYAITVDEDYGGWQEALRKQIHDRFGIALDPHTRPSHQALTRNVRA